MVEITPPPKRNLVPPEGDVTPKETVQEKRVEAQEPSLEQLSEAVSANNKKLGRSFEEFIAGRETGWQFEEVLNQYTNSLFELNGHLNSQLPPELVESGHNEDFDNYWTLNDILNSLAQDLSNKETPLRNRFVLAKRYYETLMKGHKVKEKKEEYRFTEGRLGLFERLQKQGISEAGKIRAAIPELEGKPEQPEPSELRPGAKHYELVSLFNPNTGRRGHFLYWLGEGKVIVEEVGQNGENIGKSFTLEGSATTPEQAEALIYWDIRSYEEKGLQITRNVPLTQETAGKAGSKLPVGEEKEVKREVRLIRTLENKRANIEDAWLNFEDAQEKIKRSLESAPHKKTVFGPSLEYRKEKYAELVEIALKELNTFLSTEVTDKKAGDNGEDFMKFTELGQRLSELDQSLSKLHEEKFKTASLKEERDKRLKEYGRVLEERYDLFRRIVTQRVTAKTPEVSGEITQAALQEKPQIPIKTAKIKTGLDEVISEKPTERPAEKSKEAVFFPPLPPLEPPKTGDSEEFLSNLKRLRNFVVENYGVLPELDSIRRVRRKGFAKLLRKNYLPGDSLIFFSTNQFRTGMPRGWIVSNQLNNENLLKQPGFEEKVIRDLMRNATPKIPNLNPSIVVFSKS